jgi:O-antigen/teichoic acid export membrane protein
MVAPASIPPVTAALVVASLAVSVAASLALQVPLGLGRTLPWSLRYPLQNTVLIVAVLALHERWDGTGAVVAIAVSCLAAAVFAARAVAPILRGPVEPVSLPAGALRFGAMYAAGAALTQVAQRGGVVAAAVLGAAAAEVGYVALALGVALGATYAVLQAFTVSLPHVAGGTSEARADGEASLRRLAGRMLALLGPCAVAATLLAPRLVPATFGRDFRGAVPALTPALALVVLAPVASLLAQVAALRVRPRVSVASGVAALAGFALTAAVAVPAWGAAGATTAALVGTAAGVIASLRAMPGAGGEWLPALSALAVVAVLAAGWVA